MDYRRLYIPGGTYFFTIVTYRRKPIFSDSRAVDLLRNAFKYTIALQPFSIVASVIIPNHLHMIWTLPENDSNFSTRWRLIKSYFTRHWRDSGSREPVWQPRFWEHLIRDDVDLGRHIEYIHYNPVKHRLTNSLSDWPYSSFLKFVQEGFYPIEWGKNEEVWAGDEMME
jgi:putative transposase